MITVGIIINSIFIHNSIKIQHIDFKHFVEILGNNCLNLPGVFDELTDEECDVPPLICCFYSPFHLTGFTRESPDTFCKNRYEN